MSPALSADRPDEVILSGQKDMGDKLREMKLAIELEKKYSKDQILEGYLNIVFFNRDAYGIEAASRYFFSTTAKDLTLPQAALLAGLVNSPSFYDPAVNPENVAARGATRSWTEMLQPGQDHCRLSTTPPSPPPWSSRSPRSGRAAPAPSMAPYFCDYISHLILNNPAYGSTSTNRQRKLYRGGLTITTTLDSRLQAAAQAQVDATAGANPDKWGAALVSVQPGTGQDPGHGAEHRVPARAREVRHAAELQRRCQGSRTAMT